MANIRRVLARTALVVAVLLICGTGYVTKSEAHRLLNNPAATRLVSDKTPADTPWNLVFEDAKVTSADGTVLRGWFMPADSPKLVLVQHGYKDRLQTMLNLSALFHRHGYQVMLMCVRSHDHSDGTMLSFGQHGEIEDMEAWYRYAKSRPGVNASQIGMFGVSMGGYLAIQYTATHPEIRALVADSAFSSLDDTIDTSVKFFTGLPPFPFGPMIRFWAEREGGFAASNVDAKRWIGKISPRPVLIMQGGADRVVSAQSGQRLFEAANEPKQFWYEPGVGHGQFLKMMPDAFEQRVMGFFDTHVK